MNNELLGQITCYAVIIAMAIVVLKAINQPLNNLIESINPFNVNRRIRQMMDRINDLEMNKFMHDQDMIQLRKEIKELKSKKK